MNKTTISITVIVAIAIGIAILFFKGDNDNLSASQQSYAVTNVTGSSTGATATAKTGQFTASVDYRVPAPELNKISVTLTLDNDVVKAVTVNNVANSPASKQYESHFLPAYQAEVIGKKLSAVSLSRVGGASLTSNAFNAAVKAIAEQK
jgi:hypothetical protein